MFEFKKADRSNWEDALKLSVFDHQKEFVPSVSESLSAAYIKPWDEAFDPFIIFKEDIMIGFFYLSYTPDSTDNYWLGGFFIDKHYQNSSFGSKALDEILEFIKTRYPKCELVSLTFEKNNSIAHKLYEKKGFREIGKVNYQGEIIMSKDIRLPICE